MNIDPHMNGDIDIIALRQIEDKIKENQEKIKK
jgi:hypothetical protein